MQLSIEPSPQHETSVVDKILRKFKAWFKQHPKAKNEEFISTLSEDEQYILYDFAINRLLGVWRVDNTGRANKDPRIHRAIVADLLDRIPPYFRLDDKSPIGEKSWGDLTGREWGTIGNRGFAIQRLLGNERTAFDLVGKKIGYNERFNQLVRKLL